ncbi:MAG: hypothetical protein LBL45_03045 [Treponema sp.]|nr:hypothetical protein [Treponema sp.]
MAHHFVGMAQGFAQSANPISPSPTESHGNRAADGASTPDYGAVSVATFQDATLDFALNGSFPVFGQFRENVPRQLVLQKKRLKNHAPHADSDSRLCDFPRHYAVLCTFSGDVRSLLRGVRATTGETLAPTPHEPPLWTGSN